MMEFIDSYNLTGLVIGISTFLIIGLFHPVVIKCEYYFGTRCWWMFLIFGILGIIAALYVRQVLWSSLLGVFAFSSFWTILEIDVYKRQAHVSYSGNPKVTSHVSGAASLKQR